MPNADFGGLQGLKKRGECVDISFISMPASLCFAKDHNSSPTSWHEIVRNFRKGSHTTSTNIYLYNLAYMTYM